MKKIFTIASTLFYLGINVYAQVGTIDTGFGSLGVFTFPLLQGTGTGVVTNMTVLSNDQIISSVDDEYGSFLHKGKLNKITANGLLDNSFGVGGTFVVEDSTYGYSNVIQMPNGKFLASWQKYIPNVTLTDDYPFLTMHNADGSFASNFGTNGILNVAASPTGGTIGGKIVADANNNIYVMHEYNNVNVVRSYTSTGAINANFGNNGILSLSHNTYNYMLYTPNSGGRLLLARYDSSEISQYTLTGQLDFTYGSAGVVSIPALMSNVEAVNLLSMSIQSDSKLLVHLFEINTTQAISRVVRINTDGTLDATFSNNTPISVSSLTGQIFGGNALIQQPDGKILLGGSRYDFSNESTQKAFFRLNNDGTIDNNFGTNGLLTLGVFGVEYIVDVKLQSTGKILGLVNNTIITPASILRILNNLNVGILESANINELGLYPNPVQSSFELSYELKEATMISIDLLDNQGRIVHHLQENKMENGAQAHNFVLPASIASGTYTVSIRSANGTQNNFQIIVK